MSEPIILTEREREVFAELVSHLMGEAHNRDTERAWQLGEVLRAWLRDMEPPAESASPPRAPADVGYKTAREVDYERGYRAGIEAAAKWHDQQAAEWNEHYAEHGDSFAREYAKQHRTDAAAIRALADKPALDHGWKIGDIRCDACDNGVEPGWIHCAWCGAEIAARKGG